LFTDEVNELFDAKIGEEESGSDKLIAAMEDMGDMEFKEKRDSEDDNMRICDIVINANFIIIVRSNELIELCLNGYEFE